MIANFFYLGLLYAFIFGQVTSIIQQLQKPNSDFHSKLDSIRRFTKLYTVPEEIGARLIDYFRTTWTTNKGLDVEEVILNQEKKHFSLTSAHSACMFLFN